MALNLRRTISASIRRREAPILKRVFPALPLGRGERKVAERLDIMGWGGARIGRQGDRAPRRRIEPRRGEIAGAAVVSPSGDRRRPKNKNDIEHSTKCDRYRIPFQKTDGKVNKLRRGDTR